MKSWLYDNGVEMYSTNNKVKSAVAEKFIGTLKNQIYKHMNLPKMCTLINSMKYLTNATTQIIAQSE